MNGTLGAEPQRLPVPGGIVTPDAPPAARQVRAADHVLLGFGALEHEVAGLDRAGRIGVGPGDDLRLPDLHWVVEDVTGDQDRARLAIDEYARVAVGVPGIRVSISNVNVVVADWFPAVSSILLAPPLSVRR